MAFGLDWGSSCSRLCVSDGEGLVRFQVDAGITYFTYFT